MKQWAGAVRHRHATDIGMTQRRAAWVGVPRRQRQFRMVREPRETEASGSVSVVACVTSPV
jgi:hypothetical protein